MFAMPPGSLDADSALQVQVVEGGFLVLMPPGSPLAAQDAGEVLETVWDWLGMSHEPAKHEPGALQVTAQRPRWDGVTAKVPSGAMFQCLKLRRKRTKRRAFQTLWHFAAPGSASSKLHFDRVAVMESLRDWIVTEPPAPNPAEEIEQLVIDTEIDPDDENVVLALVTTGEEAFGSNPALAALGGPPTYVISSEDPPFQWGVSEPAMVEYMRQQLGDDPRGTFAVLIDLPVLRVGPRVEDDDGDTPVPLND